MGLLLLIPGLVLMLNDTTWFKGEDPTGKVLIAVGAVILVLQIIATLIAGRKVKRSFDRIGRDLW